MLCKSLLNVTRQTSLLTAPTNLLSKAAVPWVTALQTRLINYATIDSPKPGTGRPYRYFVHYPKDGKYTIKHLDMTFLGGRDPETGRIVVGTWGGGRKPKYRWVDYRRTGPTEAGQAKEEKVIEVQYDPNRSAFIALVGAGSHLRYIIATTTMNMGDVIKSTSHIPEIPGPGKPGDSFSLGALANGTEICCVERFPGEGAFYLMGAGNKGTVLRRRKDGRVVVQVRERLQVALEPTCNAVVGQVSNEFFDKVHVGSATRLRWIGFRPRSGLHQRKTGYHGRKVRPLPPAVVPKKGQGVDPREVLSLSCVGEDPSCRVVPKTNRRS